MKEIKEKIVDFLIDYQKTSRANGYVIGVSGGIDSAVVSTLCAETGLPVTVISMPITQKGDEISRSDKHIDWLTKKYSNVKSFKVDMTDVFNLLKMDYKNNVNIEDESKHELAKANTRSRLRMTMLYFYSNSNNYLVVGTGNKVEDYGVGFFTKGGDGLVDISPIGDLMKSEVRELGKFLDVSDEIIKAKPTDGLWDDGRSDEDQLGATYVELEWAMNYIEKNPRGFAYSPSDLAELNVRQREVLSIYKTKHLATSHKMLMPPICRIK
jgi:NAD+ synthase